MCIHASSGAFWAESSILRGIPHPTTTLAEEIEKTVEEMQKLDVVEKRTRFCISNGLHWDKSAYDDYDAERESAWDDVSETDTDGQEITAVTIRERLECDG
ncbi:hypothetical protein AC579_2596 [Pseudocercospora musae]|uniref:Uncharacterized protein n=1 Tax=Pseudocercospora musae TaxID=113226 RepID=A0A139IF72_9PEZI|nr:hypothetical protein AC579_2596 [Pseudocercospora musae]